MPQANLPSADDAFDTLYSRAYARGVLEVMASRGYPARTEKQAADLLDIAARVRAAAPAEKEAGDLYAEAAGDLARLTGGAPARGKEAADREAGFARAAQALAADPAVYNAVLAIKADEADSAG